ncbi:Flagellar hook-associated protein 3 [Curvibacter sp. AEP1-3]|jgi:flagellar hook-associated protein 3 FlgL|uniref:flagellar hook-associated protein FlgL n=1 Tax=Curvibacter sp. AEP1-3 TaxID=1844971 RepID=UPI000B3C24AC|nr:flagellar hook-associated protein FlgL [Curvibacter sp. AEP1-3]ARV18943.1 Flagellar hook-associated protein 3 [Curvibacter sp. AEP1-3]
MPVNLSRLASANAYDNALSNLSKRQTALSNLQENLTSGKRVVRPSDDPTAAAQAERSLMRLSRIATDQRALEVQRNTMANAESTLGDVVDALQQFRELVVSAGNGSHTAAERQTIANQLQGLREQILGYANRTDTNGQPLFGALASASVPFTGPTATAPDYTYNGLPGQTATSETAIASSLDGESAFMHQPARDGVYNVSMTTIPAGRSLSTGNVSVTDSSLVTRATYKITFGPVVAGATAGTSSTSYIIEEIPATGDLPTFPGPPYQVGPFTVPDYPSAKPVSVLIADQVGPPAITGMPGLSLTITGTPAAGDVITVDPNPSIFSVMDDAIRDIGGAVNASAASQAVGQAIYNLDIGMNRVSAIRGQAGDLLNRADRITSNQESRSIQLEADRSRAEDLDMIKGVADFQNQQTGYQAALQSYAQVQKLSLFNYIS